MKLLICVSKVIVQFKFSILMHKSSSFLPFTPKLGVLKF